MVIRSWRRTVRRGSGDGRRFDKCAHPLPGFVLPLANSQRAGSDLPSRQLDSSIEPTGWPTSSLLCPQGLNRIHACRPA